MDWSQVLYLTLLVTALALGRPPLDIGMTMVSNLTLTMVLAADPNLVAVADLACGVMLIGSDRRGQTVAFIFAAMAVFEVVAHRLQLANGAIYTITDLMAYVQLGVVGGVDRGMGFIRRAADRRNSSDRSSVALGSDAGGSVADNQASYRGGLNGR